MFVGSSLAASQASNRASWFSSNLRLENDLLQYKIAFFSGAILQKMASVYCSAASWNFLAVNDKFTVRVRVDLVVSEVKLTLEELVARVLELVRLLSLFLREFSFLAGRGVEIDSLDLFVDFLLLSIASAFCVRNKGLVVQFASLSILSIHGHTSATFTYLS